MDQNIWQEYWKNEVMFHFDCGAYEAENLSADDKEAVAECVADKIAGDDYLWDIINDRLYEHIDETIKDFAKIANK